MRCFHPLTPAPYLRIASFDQTRRRTNQYPASTAEYDIIAAVIAPGMLEIDNACSANLHVLKLAGHFSQRYNCSVQKPKRRATKQRAYTANLLQRQKSSAMVDIAWRKNDGR